MDDPRFTDARVRLKLRATPFVANFWVVDFLSTSSERLVERFLGIFEGSKARAHAPPAADRRLLARGFFMASMTLYYAELSSSYEPMTMS